MESSALLGDIGGTNARFALSPRAGQVTSVLNFTAAEYAQFDDALTAYLSGLQHQVRAGICEVRIAAAGPVENTGEVRLTNSPWRISEAGLCRTVGADRARLFNDLEAVALALPHLQHNDTSELGDSSTPNANGTRIAINVGTGFGAAVALSSKNGGTAALPSEAGHMKLAASTPDETQLLASCHSLEDFLSGYGVVEAYRTFAEDDAACKPPDLQTAADVFDADGDSHAATRTVQAFTSVLGRISGDLVLATGSWGGCYLCGSVVKGWSAKADGHRFRQFFEDKGKMSSRMKAVPTRLIQAADPALLGLSYA